MVVVAWAETTYIMHIGKAHSRGCYSDIDLVAGELIWLGGSARLDRAIFGSCVDGEGRHDGCEFVLV